MQESKENIFQILVDKMEKVGYYDSHYRTFVRFGAQGGLS